MGCLLIIHRCVLSVAWTKAIRVSSPIPVKSQVHLHGVFSKLEKRASFSATGTDLLMNKVEAPKLTISPALSSVPFSRLIFVLHGLSQRLTTLCLYVRPVPFSKLCGFLWTEHLHTCITLEFCFFSNSECAPTLSSVPLYLQYLCVCVPSLCLCPSPCLRGTPWWFSLFW